MPVVAKVEGVKIIFYTNEHPPPHFHARIAEHHAVIDIESLQVIQGHLPYAKRRKVIAWATARKAVLTETFNKAIAKEYVEPIE